MRGRRVDWLLGGAIALRTLYGLAMLPLIPLLLGTHPVLLALLSGSTVAEIVLGAQVRVGEVGWVVAVLAGPVVWVLTDWLYWAAGRRWGDRALVRVIRRKDPAHAVERAHRAERIAHRLGPWGVPLVNFLPVPGPVVYAAAGAGGMRLGVFVLLNAAGQVAFALVMVLLGWALGRRAIEVVQTGQQYALVITLAIVAALVVAWLVRRRSRAGAR